MIADEMRNDWTAAAQWVWKHMEAKGFHDVGLTSPEVMLGVRLALCHTEAAEATQEIKRHWTANPSTGLRDKVVEELADTVIRILDLSICHEIDLDWTTDRLVPRIGGSQDRHDLMQMTNYLHGAIAKSLEDTENLSVAIHACHLICWEIGRDLWAAVELKMVKNIARPHRYGTPMEAK